MRSKPANISLIHRRATSSSSAVPCDSSSERRSMARKSQAEPLDKSPSISVLVELFRTLIFYLHEHRVAVPLMLEVAIVSELREILLNQPTTLNAQLYANALLLAVLGSLLLTYRLVRRTLRPPTPTRSSRSCRSHDRFRRRPRSSSIPGNSCGFPSCSRT